jgi:hypothetical protein
VLNANAFKLALACAKEPNKLREAVRLVREGSVAAPLAFETVTTMDCGLRIAAAKAAFPQEIRGRTADVISLRIDYRKAEALVYLYRNAPAGQRRSLVAAGQKVGLDLQPLISIRSHNNSIHAIRHSFRFGDDWIRHRLYLVWFDTHPSEKVRNVCRNEHGRYPPSDWWSE